MRDNELHEGWYRVDELPKGEFVKRAQFAKKVYRRGNYDRMSKAYELHDYEDSSRWMLVRGSIKVWAGFVY